MRGGIRTYKKRTGFKGEKLAAQYLIGHGYRVVQQNFTTRWAEIDIIASKANTIYFFEVKTRRSLRYGHPFTAVSPRKIYKIQHAALVFLQRYKLSYQALAVGVIGVLGPDRIGRYQIECVPKVHI